MAAHLAAAIEGVAARFADVTVGGKPLRVVTDSDLVNPPCVFLPLPELEFHYGKRRATATWTAYLVGPQAPGQGTVTANLGAMLDAVMGLFAYTTGEVYALTLPGGGPQAQAYKLTWIGSFQIGE